jgi:hypothetical protein
MPLALARVADRMARACRLRATAEIDAGAAAERRVDRLARKAERQAAKERVAALRRASETAPARAFEHYVAVRAWARRIADDDATVDLSLTPAEQQLVTGLRPLWNATPAVIAKLRHACEPISGVCPADYEPSSSALGKRLRRDLKRLLMGEHGQALFVPEPPVLGAFGHKTQGGRYNADTLKFFHVLVALHDGAVLGSLRHGGRRLVWEPSGGWGGFAYQLKTVCPDVTYLITGLPDTLLVSAVYLQTVLPNACCRFYDPSRPDDDDVWRNWEQADFIFAPEAALSDLRPPQLDLAVDILALQHMSPARAAAHVQWAFDRGCRYFYSLHPGSCSTNARPGSWQAIERLYWLHPVAPRVEVAKTDVDYSHVIGWRRLRV